jgi:nicotinamidase-related amidase
MGLNEINGKQTGLLFFDMIKGFYDDVPAPKRARLQPIVDSAALIMRAGREAGLPIFFARGMHRADGNTSTQINYANDSITGGPNYDYVQVRAGLTIHF